jgi:hypothetical protein
MISFKTIFFIILLLIIIYLVFFRSTEHYIPSLVDNKSMMNIASVYNTNKNTVFNNIDVTNTITANDLIIDEKLEMNNFYLDIDASGVLNITNKAGKLIWSTRKLIGSALYDPTGRYAFFVDYCDGVQAINDEPVICTHMFDTNSDGFGLQRRIPNIAQHGGISDSTGKYMLSVDSAVWYKTPGIKLQNCFDISLGIWPTIDLGIKQGQLNYDNVFIVPLEQSAENPHSGFQLFYTGKNDKDPQMLLMTYK